jgi:branched-chain amino acid transport system permease protein
MGFSLSKGAMTLVTHMMIFSIFAMGYDICLGFTRQCSLGHSVFFGAGAYGAVLSMLHLKLGVLSAVLCGSAVGLISALVVGAISVRLSEAYFVIVTAIFTTVFFLLALDMTWLTGGDDGLCCTPPKLSFGPLQLSIYNASTNYFFVMVFAVLSYLILKRMIESPLGNVFISVRENAKRTEFLGYNVLRYKLAAFCISGLFSGLSGALYAITLRYTSADFFHIYWSIIPIVWCLLGGLGTLIGPCLGAVIMSLFQYYVSAWWTHYLILFGILILIILRVSHRGIVGYLLGRRSP